MKKKLIKILKLGTTATAKDTYIVFAGNAFAGLLGMAGMILLSRKLGPAGFGVFSVSFAFLALMSKLGDIGLNFALVKNVAQSRARGDEERPPQIFLTVFWSKIVLCLIMALGGLFFGGHISSRILRAPESAGSNRLVFLFLFAFVFFDLTKAYLQANRRFKESIGVYILANFFKISLIVLSFIFAPQFKHFILIYIFTPFIASLFFMGRMKVKIKAVFYKREFKELMRFASWMGVAVIFSALTENLNVFMVSSKLSSFQTGIYSAAEKFMLPTTIFAGALGSVLSVRASEFLEFTHLKAFLKKIIILQFGFLILYLLALPLANFLPYILGRAYVDSVKILQILILASFFQMALAPLNSLFYPLNKSIIFAIDAVFQLLLLFSLNKLLIPTFEARGAALSLLLVNFFTLILNYLFLMGQLKKHDKKTISLG